MRNKELIAIFKRGERSLDEVGVIFNLTRERVRQIVHIFMDKEEVDKTYLKFRRFKKKIVRQERRKSNEEKVKNHPPCSICGKKKWAMKRNGDIKKPMGCCDADCKKISDERRYERLKVLIKANYLRVRNTPEFKERRRKYGNMYYHKNSKKINEDSKRYLREVIMKDPVRLAEYRKKLRERSKIQRERIKKDPVKLAKYRKRCREWSRRRYKELKKDPIRLAKYRKKSLERSKAYYQKTKSLNIKRSKKI